MGLFSHDVRYALRMFTRNRGFTAVVLLVLALGIGANTAIFSIVDALILRPLPFAEPGRLVAIWESEMTTLKWPKMFSSFRDLDEWGKKSASFEQMAGYRWWEYTLTGLNEPARILGVIATPNFFTTLGVHAAIGRTFDARDVTGGNVAVLSYDFWQNRLAGDVNGAMGRIVYLDDQPFTVIGVMPKGFDVYPPKVAAWTLLKTGGGKFKPKEHIFCGVGRLKPGVTREAAASELVAIRRGLEQAGDPDDLINVGAVVNPLQDELHFLVGNIRPGLLMIFGAIALMLLIAATNVANLLLGRAMERRKELGIRAALGSGRARLVRQLLTESIILSLAGAALGILLSVWALSYFISVNPYQMPPGHPIEIDWRALAFTSALAILTGILFGVLPAWQGSRLDLNEVLKEGGQGSAGARSPRARRMLAIVEVALSLVFLCGALLLIESFDRLISAPLGFQPKQVLTARVDLPSTRYPDLTQRIRFAGNVLERLRHVAGVRDAAVCTSLPLRGGGFEDLTVEGEAPRPRGQTQWVGRDVISPSYLGLMNIPLLRGRALDEHDRQASDYVVVVSESLARRYFPHGDALGKRVRIGPKDSPWMRVVGIAGDVKGANVFKEMDWQVTPLAYVPYPQVTGDALRSVRLLAKMATEPHQATAAFRDQVHQVDSILPIADVLTLDEILADVTKRPHFRSMLLASFAAIALVLAVIGIYGVMAQSVVQRRREIGIRMAVGASPGDVLRLILRHGLLLTLAGIALGVAGAVAISGVLQAFLYEVGPRDPALFLGAALLMLIAALAAVAVPARRASRAGIRDCLS